MPQGSCAPPRPVVDSALLAAKIAAARDATARVRAVLPASADAFIVDRTTRESLGLSPGQKVQAVLYGNRIELIPLEPAKRLSRFLDTRLPMADSVVLATARLHDAALWTQDADFKGLRGVR